MNLRIYHADADKVSTIAPRTRTAAAQTAAGLSADGAILRSPFDGVTRSAAGAVTAAQVMAKSGLDWRVLEKALQTEDGVPVPTHKAIIRADTKGLLGVVGDGFTPLQNAEAFSFADQLVSDGRMEFISAGMFDSGKRIFIQCKLNSTKDGLEDTEIVPGDAVVPYFMIANGHDGSLSVKVLFTSIRVVCQNTFAMALSEGNKRKDTLTIKHTTSLPVRMADAHDLFAWGAESFGNFVTAARSLAKKKVGPEKVLVNYFRTVFDVKPEEVMGEQLKNREENLLQLFQVGAGNSMNGVRGSWWAAANAVTQYLTHESRTAVRGAESKGAGPDERLILQRSKRLESNLFGGNQRIAQRAVELALAS